METSQKFNYKYCLKRVAPLLTIFIITLLLIIVSSETHLINNEVGYFISYLND
ncbi:hypothetical protein HNQ03_002304 [Chryseobacterium sp. 16F]|uniref:Uncharacterized protein n=1 Tax=Frigoriflavimonas asaccharolytica TaxID=2735899 RepID=A0A8J8GCJ5_9FLAO|nr:hypothetical protein [Frigoriflavimonas asaccharolytica]